jgi:hypothetical protein
VIDQQQFQRILDAARFRDVSGGVDTMVVSAHLAQMRLFMVRQGLEFYARQDSYNQRREFIRRVVDFNELPTRIDGIIDAFLCTGRGLWFFRPSGELYRIHYFDREQYRAYYDEEGRIEEAEIVYPIAVRSNRGGADLAPTSPLMTQLGMQVQGEQRWVYLLYRADRIEQKISSTKPEFGRRPQFDPELQTVTNSLGFIPAVEVFNNRGLSAGSGYGEFDWLAGHILQHDRMLRNIRENLEFFGNPTLVSSRPRHDLIEPGDQAQANARPSVASNSGFTGMRLTSTRTMAPTGSEAPGGGLRVPRIIANVEAADRVGFIQVDPVPGDLMNHANRYQEAIRAALGGVDDLSINSGATAFEVRTLYGRVSATAKRKNRDLLDYGLCQLFALMIQHEERVFRESLAAALNLRKPEPVLEEDVPPEQREKALAGYEQAMAKWRDALDGAIKQVVDTGEIPPQAVGLIPDGDTRVDWRWQGEVFPDSPQELLQNSIVCRNLQELGVGSVESLTHLFPDKTPEEIAGMLSGYPFRMVEATQRSVGIFTDMAKAMFQVPHPQEPDLPLAADPNLDLVPYLYRTLDFLRRELSYSGTYADVDSTSLADSLSDADRVRAALGRTTELERARTERRERTAKLGQLWNAAGLNANGGSVAAGVQPAGRPADTEQPLPGLGGTLNWDPAGLSASASDQLPPGPSGLFGAGAGGPAGLPPDLAAPTNAGVPLGGAAAGPAGPAGRGQPAGGRTASRKRRTA